MLHNARATVSAIEALDVMVPASCRLRQAERLAEDVHARRVPLSLDNVQLLYRLAESERTINETLIIVRSLSAHPVYLQNPTTRDKLHDMLSGAVTSDHDANNLARSTQFELLLYCLFLLGGAHVVWREPDLWVDTGELVLGIAAKRFTSLRKATRRVQSGLLQIRKSGQPGVIALSVDPLVRSISAREPSDSVNVRGMLFNQRTSDLRRKLSVLPELDFVEGLVLMGTTTTWRHQNLNAMPDSTTEVFYQFIFFSDDEQCMKYRPLYNAFERGVEQCNPFLGPTSL